jgi:hypothetical protein
MEKAQPEESDSRPIIALTIIVAIILIAATTTAINPRGGVETWIPQVGDFVEWATTNGEHILTYRWTVVHVSDTTMRVNTSVTVVGDGTSYLGMTFPKNQTFGMNFNPDHPPPGYTITKVGTENLTTKWGPRSCDHYHVTISAQNSTSTEDWWIMNGVILESTEKSQGRTYMETLTDTNISMIINA